MSALDPLEDMPQQGYERAVCLACKKTFNHPQDREYIKRNNICISCDNIRVDYV